MCRTPFFEYLPALVDSLAKLALCFFRQCHDVFALGRTTALKSIRTLGALNEQQMTAIVLTVRMIVTWFAALMTNGYDVIGNTFAESFIKYKVLTNEFVFDSALFCL